MHFMLDAPMLCFSFHLKSRRLTPDLQAAVGSLVAGTTLEKQHLQRPSPYKIDEWFRPGPQKQRLVRVSSTLGNEHIDLTTVLVDVANVDKALHRRGANGFGRVADDGVHDGHGPVGQCWTGVDLFKTTVVCRWIGCYPRPCQQKLQPRIK